MIYQRLETDHWEGVLVKQLVARHRDETQSAFDETWPFRNVFSRPVPGYRGSFIAFADGIKAAPEDWPAWRDRFEALLAQLEALAARVNFAESESRQTACYVYARGRHDGAAASGEGSDWTRWRLNAAGREAEETLLHL